VSAVRCVANPHALVGEAPVWDDRRGVLWWVDVKQPRLFRYDPASGDNDALDLPERVGCVALRENGGLIAAFMSGFKWLDPATGATLPIADPEPHLPGNRFNDGKCDRRGRLLAGTMDNEEVACTGSLYRVDPDLAIAVMATDVHLSNGLGWSPDDRLLYYTDSLRRTIWVYDYDLVAGAIDNCRVFATVPADAGVPDGLCVDAEGFVWSAHWGGARLTRYAPDGRIERVVATPVPQPSCPAFGGPDLATLYVTSAAIGMSAADLAAAPHGGGLLALEVGVRGLPTNRFAG
jgi:sugar lactone lactonase YvrE